MCETIPMVRPCFLVVDREFPGSISTRKLVIETAKFNVITAYSASEAVETLRLFRNLTAAVIDDGIEGVVTESLVQELKSIVPELKVIVVAAPYAETCPSADYQVRSFDPASLLETIRRIAPKETDEIELNNEALSHQHLS